MGNIFDITLWFVLLKAHPSSFGVMFLLSQFQGWRFDYRINSQYNKVANLEPHAATKMKLQMTKVNKSQY